MPGIFSGVIRQRRFTRARLDGRAAPTSFRRGNCQRALCFAGASPRSRPIRSIGSANIRRMTARPGDFRSRCLRAASALLERAVKALRRAYRENQLPRPIARCARDSMNPSRYPAWAELAVLTAAFALSHAFRTVVTLVAMSLRSELGLDNETIGLVGAAFHITFGVMQLPMGVALDLYGPRRVVAAVFPVAVGGAILTVLSSDAQSLVAGQLLIGLGCSPVFLAALVIIGRSYPPEQFSRLSGIVLGVGGAGMLITGTPLAWVVDAWSWRAAYLVLALALSGGMGPRPAPASRRAAHRGPARSDVRCRAAADEGDPRRAPDHGHHRLGCGHLCIFHQSAWSVAGAALDGPARPDAD